MGYLPELRWLVLLPRLVGSNRLALPFRGKTYTFQAKDVYVLPRYVYVATKQGIRSTEKPYALGDRRMEVDGGKGELIMGKTYSIPREG